MVFKVALRNSAGVAAPEGERDSDSKSTDEGRGGEMRYGPVSTVLVREIQRKRRSG